MGNMRRSTSNGGGEWVQAMLAQRRAGRVQASLSSRCVHTPSPAQQHHARMFVAHHHVEDARPVTGDGAREMTSLARGAIRRVALDETPSRSFTRGQAITGGSAAPSACSRERVVDVKRSAPAMRFELSG